MYAKVRPFEYLHMPYFSYKIPNFSSKLALKILIFVPKTSPNFLSKSAGQPEDGHHLGNQFFASSSELEGQLT